MTTIYVKINNNNVCGPILEDGFYYVKKHKETRSEAQNRLYHKWITDLCGEFEKKGVFISHDDLHEGLRDRLIRGYYEVNQFSGKRKLKRKTTTKLKKKEFDKYIGDIEKYLWQTYEIAHPLPTDIGYNS